MLTLISRGGEVEGTPLRNMGGGQVRQVSGVNGRTAVLSALSIKSRYPLGINSEIQLHINEEGSYSELGKL